MGDDCVYYELKRKMYWPDTKATFERVIREFRIC